MSSHAEYSLHYQTTPTQISTQRKPFHSFVAMWVLLDYVVRRYIEYTETAHQEALHTQVDNALHEGPDN